MLVVMLLVNAMMLMWSIYGCGMVIALYELHRPRVSWYTYAGGSAGINAMMITWSSYGCGMVIARFELTQNKSVMVHTYNTMN